jgi:hypothetical protein
MTLHETNGLSASIDRTASARSWVSGRPDLGSSNRVVLPCRKRNRHFFSRDHLQASVPYTDPSSAWIPLALRPLRVKTEWPAFVPLIIVTREHRLKTSYRCNSPSSIASGTWLDESCRGDQWPHAGIIKSLWARPCKNRRARQELLDPPILIPVHDWTTRSSTIWKMITERSSLEKGRSESSFWKHDLVVFSWHFQYDGKCPYLHSLSNIESWRTFITHEILSGWWWFRETSSSISCSADTLNPCLFGTVTLLLHAKEFVFSKSTFAWGIAFLSNYATIEMQSSASTCSEIGPYSNCLPTRTNAIRKRWFWDHDHTNRRWWLK